MNKLHAIMALVAALALTGCPSSGGGGGGGGSNSLAGTITVADAAYWSTLKLGVFSGNTLGDYPNLTYDSDMNDVYRLVYSDADDGSDVTIAPMATPTGFSGTTGTSESYVLELPADVPAYDSAASDFEYYFVAVWFDADGDGNLDLKDADPVLDEATTILGELSRLPQFDTVDDISDPDNPRATTITVTRLEQERDATTDEGTGGYKYAGTDDSGYNEQLPLNRGTNSGFDFDVTTNTGW